MTRTSKYLNQDTIAALQSFQIEKIDREITDYLELRVVLPTPVNKCFVAKNAENGLLWTAASLLFIRTTTNLNGMSLSWIH